MNKNKLFISLIGLPLLFGAIVFAGLSLSTKADAEGAACNQATGLYGSVDHNQATVTNSSFTNPNCEYTATLAVYSSPKEPHTDGWIEAQTLINSVTVKLAGGETKTVTVDDGGSCGWKQADLFAGDNVLQPPKYTNNLSDSVYQTSCDVPTPTPELSGTPTPQATPTPGGPGNVPSNPSTNTTEATTCTAATTTKDVANKTITSQGDKATVSFFITEGDSANIYYKVEGQSDWQYSVIGLKPNSDNFVSYTIQGLNPKAKYVYGVQQTYGCGGGQVTNQEVAALAFTGNELWVYAIVLTGGLTLISGMVLKKIGK